MLRDFRHRVSAQPPQGLETEVSMQADGHRTPIKTGHQGSDEISSVAVLSVYHHTSVLGGVNASHDSMRRRQLEAQLWNPALIFFFFNIFIEV